MPYSFHNLEKMAQNVSSAAVVVGVLRVKGKNSLHAGTNPFFQSKRSPFYKNGHNW